MEVTKTYTNRVDEILGNKIEEKLESASLKHGKFLKLGGNSQKDELQKLVDIARKHHWKACTWPNSFSQFSLTLGGRLAINMSNSVIENAGIALHRHFNIPYIPGSALKGIARHQAWIEWKKAGGEEKKAIEDRAKRVFGSAPENSRNDEEDNQMGCIGFMPAYASEKWQLVVDVLTPHGSNDYTNPIPCFFVAVEKGSQFSFALQKLLKASDEDMAQALEWLNTGLCSNGAGAKNNSGYGWFYNGNNREKGLTIHLVSPGFFGGSHQYGENAQSDTLLRPSSLRGMLRLWWRVLCRDYFDETDLKDLENFLWGSTDYSGIIQLKIEPDTGNKPSVIFNKKSFAIDKNKPENKGLLYLAYGMDEKIKNEEKKRHFCLPGSQWTLWISLRNDQDEYVLEKNTIILRSKQIMNQAKAALSMLCRYGGIGSRSRKGFGSINWKDSLTLDRCKQIVQELVVKLGKKIKEMPKEYGINQAIFTEIPVNHTDSWTVLDKVGLAYKKVAEDYKHNPKKSILGLPRKIDGPNKNPLNHQRRENHLTPSNLLPDLKEAKNGSKTRFASPLWIHLNKTEKGMLVRLTAFPSDQIGRLDVSKDILNEIITTIKEDLENAKWDSLTRINHTLIPTKNIAIQNSIDGKKSGDKITVEFIEEKTNRGGWKAKIAGTKYKGCFVNNADLPENIEVGNQVDVILQSAKKENLAFRYVKEGK